MDQITGYMPEIVEMGKVLTELAVKGTATAIGKK